MFPFGGGLSHKLLMGGWAIILICIALQIARDTLVMLIVPMDPALLVVAVILGTVIVIRILHKFLSR
jgi:divalent metal cation (Fe/Co/Zn/Cd) transporter